jgi:hypothetical protein
MRHGSFPCLTPTPPTHPCSCASPSPPDPHPNPSPAVTNHGAQKLFSALRPLIQSIDSQIHETLLPFLNIFAFATPDPPPALAASTFRPYPLPPGRVSEPYSMTLAEPHFFPEGSFYHGLISVDKELPSTIPKDSPGDVRRPARPGVFLTQPLEGDVVASSDVGVQVVVHNAQLWNADESEPAGFPRGYVSLLIDSREVVRCAKRACGLVLSGMPDGPHTASASLRSREGAMVEEGVSVRFVVCAEGRYDCDSMDACQCVKHE